MAELKEYLREARAALGPRYSHVIFMHRDLLFCSVSLSKRCVIRHAFVSAQATKYAGGVRMQQLQELEGVLNELRQRVKRGASSSKKRKVK